MSAVYSNDTMARYLDEAIKAVVNIQNMADSNYNHAMSNGGQGVARDDFRIATKLRKASELLADCKRPA